MNSSNWVSSTAPPGDKVLCQLLQENKVARKLLQEAKSWEKKSLFQETKSFLLLLQETKCYVDLWLPVSPESWLTSSFHRLAGQYKETVMSKINSIVNVQDQLSKNQYALPIAFGFVL